jgi:ABC-2 type transport system ATP-binding protein
VNPRGAGDVAAPALRLDAVTRRFVHRGARRRDAAQPREIVAVDAITLTLEGGRLMGVLGPNGAGKTTLLRMLCALLAPTSGTVEVLGYDPSRQPQAVRARVGAVLGGDRSVYWRLTGRENLLYGAALHGIDGDVARTRAAELLRWVGLAERAHDLVEEYSTGMRLRLGIARALMHDPPLLILDEPTAGLDPHAARAIGAMLQDLCADGRRSVVAATHNMAEAERLCDVVAVLHQGRMIAFDAPAAIAARAALDPDRAAADPARAPTLEAAFLHMTAADAARAATTGTVAPQDSGTGSWPRSP